MNEALCSIICSRAPDLGSRDFGFSQWIGTDLTLRDFRKRFMGFGASFFTGEASSREAFVLRDAGYLPSGSEAIHSITVEII